MFLRFLPRLYLFYVICFAQESFFFFFFGSAKASTPRFSTETRPTIFRLNAYISSFSHTPPNPPTHKKKTEPRTSVVISSEPLCRSTKSWKLVPRNSMVVVEGAPRVTAPATNRRNGGGFIEDAPVRQGLVASIRFEPLRCHPSDAPLPCGGDPAVATAAATRPNPSSVATFPCATAVRNNADERGGGGLAVGSNGKTSSTGATKQGGGGPLREESVNIGGSVGDAAGVENGSFVGSSVGGVGGVDGGDGSGVSVRTTPCSSGAEEDGELAPLLARSAPVANPVVDSAAVVCVVGKQRDASE